jgi:hypothetical protein
MAHAATVVKFTALYGTTAGEPLCSVLRFDDYAVLLDCGWTEAMDPAVLEPLRRVAPQVRGVLITHPDLTHMGALPYVEKPKPKTKNFCNPCFFLFVKRVLYFIMRFLFKNMTMGAAFSTLFFNKKKRAHRFNFLWGLKQNIQVRVQASRPRLPGAGDGRVRADRAHGFIGYEHVFF